MEKHQDLQASEECIWDATWSHDGQYLVVSGADKIIQLYSFSEATGLLEKVACLEDGHERTVRRVAWSPDERFLVTASFDGSCLVWERSKTDLLRFQAVSSLEGHQNEIKGVSWNGDGTILATCGRDKMIFLWELVGKNDFDVMSVLEGHTQDIKNVKWNVYDERLYSCSYDGTIRVWEDESVDFFLAKTIPFPSSSPQELRTVWDLEFAREGLFLLATSDNLTVCLFSRPSHSSVQFEPLQELRLIPSSPSSSSLSLLLHSFPVFTIAALPSHSREEEQEEEEDAFFVCGDGTNNLSILRLQTSTQPQLTLEDQVAQAHREDINTVTARKADNGGWWIASGSDDGRLKLWSFGQNEA